MKAGWKIGIALVLAAMMVAGCSSGSGDGTDTSGKSTATPSATDKPLVFFSQANSQDPWRQVFDKDIKDAAQGHASEFTFEEQEAQGKSDTQIGQIETAIVKKPKVLIVSPTEESIQAAVEKAKDAGEFVVLVDRKIPGDKWDAYVGGDNVDIGRQAGELLGKQLNGKGTILMIRGIADASATKERGTGFLDAMKKFPGITIVTGDDCGYNREKARTYMENFLQSKRKFDAVFAHNDEMAIGAYLAMDQAKAPLVPIVGIDGCQKEVVDLIKQGKLTATFSYPSPGPKSIEVVADFLKGKKLDDKNVVLPTEMVTKDTADAYLTAHPNLAK